MKRLSTYAPLFLLLVGTAFLLSDCASLAGFQDGRSLGKGTTELSGSLNFNTSPQFNDFDNDSIGVDVPTIFAPNLEFGVKHGVTEKIDVGFRISTNLNVAVAVKGQVVGDDQSPFALGLGLEAGTFGLISGLWNIQVPVFLSVHPSEKFTAYLNPKYIYQFSSYADLDGGLSYLGSNVGLLFGKRNKFGVDFGYYNLNAGDARDGIGLIQFGIGGRFALGGDRD
jgi:hypothetical protein